MTNAVKPTPNAEILASVAGFAALLAILALWAAYGGMTGELGLPKFGWGIGTAALFASAVISVVLAIGSRWSARFWWRLEWRRQAAARGIGADNFLANEQPSSRTVPLSLPVIIGMRAKWPMKLFAWACVAPLIAVTASEAADHGVWDVRFFSALLGVIGTVVFFMPIHTGERQIEVTDDQLTVRVGRLEEETVPWEEARLFAITRGTHATLSYELSSSEARVPWIWVRPDTFSARLFEPTIPQYEYDRQMEALLALIAAKTGLPLYDLR